MSDDTTAIAFLSLGGSILCALTILLVVRIVNHVQVSPPSTKSIRRFAALGILWMICLSLYAALVVWRADAPDHKDDLSLRITCSLWAFFAFLAARTEFLYFRKTRRCLRQVMRWTVLSVIGQTATLILISVVGGAFVHIAAGGRS